MSENHPVAHPLPEGVRDDFTYACKDCGDTVTVIASTRQPHTCHTTERDELADLLWDNAEREVGALADEILAAGYAKPRQVSTVEELDALPVGSVVTRNGVAYTKNGDRRGWQIGGVVHSYSAESLLLNNNATLIYTPDPS